MSSFILTRTYHRDVGISFFFCRDKIKAADAAAFDRG